LFGHDDVEVWLVDEVRFSQRNKMTRRLVADHAELQFYDEVGRVLRARAEAGADC